MTTHPILFSTPMVQAILEGRKTMTRRIIKSPTGLFGIGMAKYEPNTNFHYHNREVIALDENERSVKNILCPYGHPGDVLWVREKWSDGCMGGYIYAGGRTEQELKDYSYSYSWRPSIHMPKAACRIFLKITDIRVERLQDIDESDAKDEGMISSCINNYCDHFMEVWETINGKKSWDENPWVWVISFERCEKPENF